MEISAAAAAAANVGKAAGRTLTGSEAEKAMIREIAKDSPGALAAGQAMGARLAAKQMAINKLLKPLFYFAGYREEYFKSGTFAEELSAKMEDVPEDQIVSPAPNVAAQAMEGLSYSLDDPDLKELYLNLLATASTERRAGSAHPSYASVIRQLSAAEATLVPLVLNSKNGAPAVEIRLVNDKGAFITLDRHVMDLVDRDTGEPGVTKDWALFVDNWIRLGLVEADYLNHRSGETAYAFVERRPEYLNPAEEREGYAVGFQKGLIKTTDFGARFAEAVLPLDGGSQPEVAAPTPVRPEPSRLD